MKKRMMQAVTGAALLMAAGGAASGAVISTAGDAGITDFNAFIFGSAHLVNSSMEGRLAVGGSATINSYSVGTAMSGGGGVRDDVIVGGSLVTGNMSLNSGGNVRYGGAHAGRAWVNNGGRAYQGPSPYDFGAIRAELSLTSNTMASLSPTGEATMQWGGITLTGGDADFNVFSVPGEWFGRANNFTINAPAGSTVLVNISGSSVDISNQGWNLRGVGAGTVLYNFHEATSLSMSGVGVQGSILAPDASVSFSSGQFAGTLVAADLKGSGSFAVAPFSGNLGGGAVPAPAGGAALALLGVMCVSRRRRR